jgi:hypothetical protein
MGISKHSDWLKMSRLITPRPSVERYQRLGATIRVHVDQERNLSSAADELRSIELLQTYRHKAIRKRIIFSEGQVNIFNLTENARTAVDRYRTLLCPSPNALLYLIHAVSMRGVCIAGRAIRRLHIRYFLKSV